jgi:class 3 adenylate cyclase/TolB-like protein/Tfp pilus assembly protein PilF
MLTPRTMTPPKIVRRLAAIMVADVAGYSRLMGTDEVGTLNALKEHRRERIDPTIARHNGRVFKTTGDGLLVEFASVVDAVGFAVAIQRTMLAFNQGIHTDRQIVLRIGINIGDIIIDGDDIFGDGVNVAARLEALCEPGGVCISRSANDQIRDRLSLAFADLGEQTVKNIARAVGVFGLAAKDIAALPEEALPAPELPERRTPLTPARRNAIGVMMGVLLVAILSSGGWWILHERTPTPVVTATTTPRPAASARDRRRSIIVLPFENSNRDLAHDNIGGDIARDLTDRIAQDCTAQLIPAAPKSVDLRAIGRDYNVHFVLTGSARRQDEHLIVSAALYDTDKDQTIWSQQFDRPDNPGEWRGIIKQINDKSCQVTIDAELARAKREHPGTLDKYDLYMEANSTPLLAISKQNRLARIALLDRALAIDPNYVLALRAKASIYASLVYDGFSSDKSADLAKAMQAIDKALQLAPEDVDVLAIKAFVLHTQGDLDAAAALQRKVVELRPMDGWRYRELGMIQFQQGHYKEALETQLAAQRLLPSTNSSVHRPVAFALLENGRFPEAIEEARLAIAQTNLEAGPVADFGWLQLIAAESENGQDAEARADLQKYLATPARTFRTIADLQKEPRLFGGTKKLLEGLRRAGMPEE